MRLFLATLPTILLTAYSQIVIKWRVTSLADSNGESVSALVRAYHYLTDPYVVSAYVVSLFAAIAWLYVAEEYPVSIAFPTYVGVLFVVVTIGSAVLLKEQISGQHMLGLALILVGVVFVSRAA